MSERDGFDVSRVPKRTHAVRATRVERALDWAAALAPAPIRVATSCCGMSMVQGGDPFEALGTGPPAVSSRSADLLVVAGPITARQVPMIRDIYERMLEPRWVIAWGACAISGGAYDNYATVAGLACVVPVDVVVPGCPPSPESLRAALECLRSGEARRAGRASGPESRGDGEWPIRRDTLPGAAEHGASIENGKTAGNQSEGNQNVDHG